MSIQIDQHAHAADLEAFLDLVNTMDRDDGAPVDRLPDAPAAIAFYAERGLAHRESLEEVLDDDRAGEKRLAKLRAVRAAAREVFDALVEHRDVRTDAIDRINEALRHRPLLQLTGGKDGCAVGHRHVGDPWDEALARTLEPFVQTVARGATERFRICDNDSCRWVFVDESRAGRRRWCDMASCGNRAKAARHRARKKAAGSDGPAAAQA